MQQTQPIVFSDYHPNVLFQGKPKGLKQVLNERSLYRNQSPDGRGFLLKCRICYNRSRCDRSLNSDCCARAVTNKHSNFQEKRGQLPGEVEATGNLVIFYPKFHRELNFIEKYSSLFPLYTFPQPD